MPIQVPQPGAQCAMHRSNLANSFIKAHLSLEEDRIVH
jgi:hypothetical protein